MDRGSILLIAISSEAMIMARVLKSMDPFGLALLDYFKGDTSAKIIIQRDDGFKDKLPISLFFRDPSDFPPLE